MEISDREFNQLSGLIYKHAGIKLKESKKKLVRARLRKRLEELEMDRFEQYYERVLSDKTGQELSYLLEAISTNVTSFFREEKHFDFMREVVLPELKQNFNRGSEQSYIHIWSAACSTGQEPYTIAITVREFFDNPDRYRVKILGTDISGQALESAKRGIYRLDDVEDVDPMLVDRYFERFQENGVRKVRVRDSLRDMVRYGRLNLNEGSYPFSRKFDLIFCRNVTIYFDQPVVQRLIERFERYMKPGGYLFMGHSESLAGIEHNLNYVQATVYQK